MDYRDYTDLILPKATNIIASIALVVLIWSGLFESNPEYMPMENLLIGNSPLALFLISLFDLTSLPAIVTSILFLLSIGGAMILINEVFSFISIRTILPSFFFLIITSIMLRPHAFSLSFVLILISALLIVACFHLYESSKNPSLSVFNIGLLIGIATQISLSFLVFILSIFVFFYKIKVISLRTVLAFLMGISIPFLYSTLYFVLTNNTDDWTNYFLSWHQSESISMWDKMSLSSFIYICTTVGITLYSIVKMILFQTSQNIKNREESLFLLTNFILVGLLIIISPIDVGLLLPVWFFFASFLIGQALSAEYNLATKIVWTIFIVSSILFLIFPNYSWRV